MPRGIETGPTREQAFPSLVVGTDTVLLTHHELINLSHELSGFLPARYATLARPIDADSFAVPSRMEIEGQGGIEISFVDNLGYVPIIRTAARNLDAHERSTIADYINRNGRLALLKRFKQSESVKRAYLNHSQLHHGGLSILTDRALLEQMTQDTGQTRPLHRSEVDSLASVRHRTRNAIRFDPVTPLENLAGHIDARALKSAIRKMNDDVSPLASIYGLNTIVEEEIAGRKGMSRKLILASLALPFILESLSLAGVNKTLVKTTAHMSGEMITAALGVVDQLKKNKDMEAFSEDSMEQIGLFGQAFNYAAENWPTILFRTGVMGVAGLSAYELSQMSEQFHNIWYFLSIGPVNTTWIYLAELGYRTFENFQLFKEHPELKADVAEYFAKKKLPLSLRDSFTRHPEAPWAWVEFAQNKGALGSWLGTFASLGLEPFSANLPPGIVEKAFQAMSGLGVETGFSALFNARQKFDAWQVTNDIVEQHFRG